MMDFVSDFARGLLVILSPTNLGACVIGALAGIIAAILPGISATALIALALPISFGLPPMAGLAFMVAAAVGMLYGRALAALYLAGYEPGVRASGGLSPLTMIILASLVGGGLVAIGVAALAPMVAKLALLLGPAEYTALMIFVLVAGAAFTPGSIFRSIAAIVLGLLLSTIGIDLETGAARLTLGIPELADGVGFVTLAIGVFVVGDIIRGLVATEAEQSAGRAAHPSSFGIGRGTQLGILAAIVPDRSLTIAASETPEYADPLDPAGRDSVDDIPGATAANNARLSASLLPMLTLGLPTSALAALLVGAFTIHGIVPGPQVISKQPDLFWGVLGAVIVAHVALLVIMKTLGHSLARLRRISYQSLAPIILAYSCFAIYSINNSPFDVALMIGFGALGYLLIRADCDRGLLAIAFVLGPLLEENIRRSMLIARGNFETILARPIVTTLLLAALVLALLGRLLLRGSANLERRPPQQQPTVRAQAQPVIWRRWLPLPPHLKRSSW
jgi:putative tricarboxylic transport membrane protein